jgi:hypothetical protein
MEIGQECPRFEAYECAFEDSTRLQNALCAYYARIVKLCTEFYQDMQKPGD